jgi:WD40 repeat protein/tRNA A-37 threonylcarbamoyl transferase component Bud32
VTSSAKSTGAEVGWTLVVSSPTDTSTGGSSPTAPTELDREVSGAPAAPVPRPAELIGRVLGRFRVVERLGAGGLGEVYRAEQELLGRAAVIKVMRRDRPVTRERAERFLREAKLAARLDHPYAAHVYAFGAEADGLLWIAMELVRGHTLGDLVRARGPMPLELFAPLAAMLCEVVNAAHELGIVHRDLKPSNVMVVSHGERLLPKLLDFGVAKGLGEPDELVAASAVPPGTTLTRDDQVLGSPDYMAPEQWQSPGDVDRRADIYALGALCYFALTGRPPYPSHTMEEAAYAHAEHPVPSLGNGASPELDAAVARALAKRPRDRYATALELGAALSAAAGASAAPPMLDAALVERWGSRAPEPLAELVVALSSARTIGEADALARTLVEALCRWLAVVALAARAPALAPERARELGRALLDGGLTPAGWLDLARALALAPDTAPESALEPLAEILAGPAGVLLADLAAPREPLAPGAAMRARLADDIEQLGDTLADMDALLAATVVAEGDGWPVQLAGARRRRPAVVWGAPLGRGEVAIIGLGRGARITLSPLCAFVPALPGGEAELFALAAGSRGVCLRAVPSGAELGGAEAVRAIGEMLDLTAESTRERAREPAPYLGLAPFSAGDARRFVGRERETETFVNLLRARRLVALVGASGAGKSSFLAAGVLASLPDGWSSVSFRPGADPARALIQAAGLAVRPEAPAADLADALVRRAAGGTLVVAVDQMEELFALGAVAEERTRFAAALARAADLGGGAVRVLLCMRDDFLARAEALEPLRGRLAGSLMVLVIPAPAELRRIVMAPALRAGYRFEDEALVDEMVAATADRPGGLALVAFTALAWWERRDEARKLLPAAAYREIGGVAGALAAHAEALYAALPASAQRAAREVVRHLVTAEGTRASLPAADLAQLAGPGGAEAVQALVAGRLLVARDDAEGDAVELAHEALIEGWPLLARVREEDAALARLRDDLRAAARGWRERGRRDDELWRGRALAELEGFRTAGVRLTDLEESFADASQALGRRTRRRRRVLLAAAAVVAAVALGVLSISERAARQSEERAQALADQAARGERDAEVRLAEGWAREGRRESASGSSLRALAYLSAAYGTVDGAGLRFALARAMSSIDAERAALRGHRVAVRRILWSPDGRYLASADEELGVHLWKMDSGRGEPAGSLEEDSGTIAGFLPDSSALAVNGKDGLEYRSSDGFALRGKLGNKAMTAMAHLTPDGRTVITFEEDGQLDLYDRASGERRVHYDVDDQISYLTGDRAAEHLVIETRSHGVFLLDVASRHRRQILSPKTETGVVRMSEDGRLVVVAGIDVTYVIDAASGSVRHTLSAHPGLHTVAISQDGRRIATGGADRAAKLWDADSGRLIATLGGHRGPISELAFDPSGQRLATACGDGAVRIYAADGALVASYEGHAADVYEISWSPDGRWLASGGADGLIKIWPAGAPQAVELAPTGTSEVLGIARCDPGRVAIARATEVAVIDVATGAPLHTAPVPDHPIALACAPGGGRMVVGTERGAVLIDLSGPAPRLHPLPGHRQTVMGPAGGKNREEDAPVPEVAMSRDGRRAVTLGGDGSVRMWDAVAVKQIQVLASRAEDRVYATSVDFGPGGDTVLVGDSSGEVVEWGVADGRARRRARLHRNIVIAVEVSPDGSRIATASSDRTLFLVRARDLAVEHSIEEHSALLSSIDWSPDGQLLVTGSEDPSAFVWEADSATLVGAVEPGADAAFGAVFAGDRIVAATRGGRIMSFPASRETRSPSAIRQILGCRLPFRLGAGGIERAQPGEGCR